MYTWLMLHVHLAHVPKLCLAMMVPTLCLAMMEVPTTYLAMMVPTLCLACIYTWLMCHTLG